ncbi:MAG: hypothetical protein SH850_28755, partial [Planctomycetaceae bacterium]|nr:hypothetical protein [Planctomycetaceae bacterium]
FALLCELVKRRLRELEVDAKVFDRHHLIRRFLGAEMAPARGGVRKRDMFLQKLEEISQLMAVDVNQ